MPAILRETISRWSDHGAARLGAALAFYAILALAPLVIFLVVVVSAIFGATGAEMRIVQDARLFLGKAGANVVSDLLASARNPAQGVIAIGLATLTLLMGASGVFSELRDSLNTVWDVKPAEEGFRSMFARKLFSFVLVLAAGLLVLVSVLATTVVSLIGRFVGALIPVPTPVLEMVNFILSFGVLAVVFALILRYVPDLVLPGKIVCIGAAVSALLFVIGKTLLGLYLSWASVGSAYGAAGSLVAIAIWVYYSSQILLLGAEFTYVWGEVRFPRELEEARKRFNRRLTLQASANRQPLQRAG